MANCSHCGVAEGVEHHGWCNDANWTEPYAYAQIYQPISHNLTNSTTQKFEVVHEGTPIEVSRIRFWPNDCNPLGGYFHFRTEAATLDVSRCEMEDCADRRAFRKLVGDRLQEVYNVALAEWDRTHPNGGG